MKPKFYLVVLPIVSIVLIILAAFIGYRVGVTAYHPSVVSSTSSQTAPLSNAIFQKQSATIGGKITQVNGNSATVVNTQGTTGTFTIAPNVLVYVPQGSGTTKTAIGISHIQLNQEDTIDLDLVGQDYQITTIFPAPSAPSSLKPIASVSSSPKAK